MTAALTIATEAAAASTSAESVLGIAGFNNRSGIPCVRSETSSLRFAFLIDVNRRGKIKLTRCSYLERFRVVDVLARLDIDGPPHTNPTAPNPLIRVLAPYNGVAVPCPHFHFYVEGYEARWAVPASTMGFQQTDDLVVALRDFMTHCGVESVPTAIQYPIQ